MDKDRDTKGRFLNTKGRPMKQISKKKEKTGICVHIRLPLQLDAQIEDCLKTYCHGTKSMWIREAIFEKLNRGKGNG